MADPGVPTKPGDMQPSLSKGLYIIYCQPGGEGGSTKLKYRVLIFPQNTIIHSYNNKQFRAIWKCVNKNTRHWNYYLHNIVEKFSKKCF